MFRRNLFSLLAGCLLLIVLSGVAVAADTEATKPVAELYVTSW